MMEDFKTISSDHLTITQPINSLLSDNCLSDELIVKLFLSQQLDLDSKEVQKDISQVTLEKAVERVIDALLKIPLQSIPNLLRNVPCRQSMTTADIPQFSNMETAMYYIPALLNEIETPLSYRELGMKIHPCKSEGAAAKYGENHAKLTISIALAKPTNKEGYAAITKSAMTPMFCSLEQSDKNDILQKLCYRIEIVRSVIKDRNWKMSLDKKISFLTDSMKKRRRHCCVDLINFALGE